MKRPSKFININTKVLIFVLTVFCVFSIILSSIFSNYSKPAKIVSGAIVVPLQDGMNGIGKWFTNKADYFNSVKKLTKKNKELESQVNELTEENSLLAQNKYELERLRDLYQLDQDYSSYEKIAANVIGKDSGNWFDIFTINKGSKDGIISGGGLVGIVTDVGKDYAKVRAIIDDESSVSVSFANTSDTGIVSGDLKLMDDGVMNVTEVLKDAKVTEGDMVVTSKISDKFVPGILVGYVTNIKLDSSELTQSGQIIPVVDFKHIDEVLVITQLKDDM